MDFDIDLLKKEQKKLSKIIEHLKTIDLDSKSEDTKTTDKIKDLSIIYVEDEILLKENFVKILKTKVKNVYAFSNGDEALVFFKNNITNIDLIISDIEMPTLNGIDLLKEIRMIDEGIPYIITSGFLDSEYLLSALNYNTTLYLHKPVNIKQLFLTIDIIYYNKTIKKKINCKQEIINKHIKALDNVVMYSRIDLNGQITYMNDLFYKFSQYTKDEIIGKSYKILIHPDISEDIFDEIELKMKNGQKWECEVKNIAKDGTSYFSLMSILPLCYNNNFEYIITNFLITDFVKKKRKFRKNIISVLTNYKKERFDLLERISYLEKNLVKLNKEVDIYKEKSKKFKNRYKKNLEQIIYYENYLGELEIEKKQKMNLYKKNLENILNKYKNLLTIKELDKSEIANLKKENIIKGKEIIKLNEKLNEQADYIKGLRDIMKNMEFKNEN